MKNNIPERLAIIRATPSLLYHSNPRAFIISAIASLPEPLFFPTIVFLLQKLFERLTGPTASFKYRRRSFCLVLPYWRHFLSNGSALSCATRRPPSCASRPGSPSANA